MQCSATIFGLRDLSITSIHSICGPLQDIATLLFSEKTMKVTTSIFAIVSDEQDNKPYIT